MTREAPGYALLVDAPWGSGKTHVIKQLTNCEADPTRLYVTLYDVHSPDAFDWALVRAMNPWSDVAAASWGERAKELASGIKVFGVQVDMTKVNLTEVALRALPDTLIFDDIERCGLSHAQLSGLINRFVEHQNKRVILIANTDMHSDKDAFDAGREKLIGQTITLHPELDAAMTAVWGRIPAGHGREALQSRQNVVAKTFHEAGHKNLRLVLHAMRDAAAMLDALEPDMLKFDQAIDHLTATFLAFHMAYHGGRLSKQDMLDRARYHSLLGSKSDAANAAFDALRAVQDDHPDCNIDSVNNRILTVDLAYALIVEGYAPKSDILEGLRITHQFSEPSEKPDWVRLWKWAKEPIVEFEAIIERLKKGFDELEITTPGEILQIYGATKFMAARGAIGLEDYEVAGFFRKYIRRLAKSGKIPPRNPGGRPYGFRDENGTCVYNGWAFDIDATDRKVIDLLKAEQDKALAQKMPEHAANLMKDLTSDLPAFISRFEYAEPGVNFSETPVLHYIDRGEAVASFLSRFEKEKQEASEILKLLGKRRAEHRKELQEEWDWIDTFKDTVILEANKVSKILGAQVATHVRWHMEAD